MEILYKNKKKIVLLFSVLFLSLFISGNVYALKLNINPPRVLITTPEGGESSGYVTILNYDDKGPLHIKTYMNDLVYLPDGSNDFLPLESTPWTVSGWLKIAPTEFELGPGEERQVRYMVNVPEGAKGGRYGVVFFEVSPSLKDLEGMTGATVNVRLGSIFLITVEGTEIYEAELQNINVGKPDKNGGFDISCTIKNKGNILVRPNGPVKIIDSKKNEIAELKLNEIASGVLPNTNRKFSVRYDGQKLAPGEYYVQVVLDFGGTEYLGGQIAFKIK